LSFIYTDVRLCNSVMLRCNKPINEDGESPTLLRLMPGLM